MHMMRSSLSSHACTPAHCGCMTSQARISIRWPGMLRQVARSSRLLSLCQAAASSRLGPSVVAEPSVGPDLTARAFGALSQPFAMCDVSKAPPKQHTPLASKPAAAARSALAQDAKKRAYTTVDEDGAFGGVLYPEPIAKIGKPAPSFTVEGVQSLRHLYCVFASLILRFTLKDHAGLLCLACESCWGCGCILSSLQSNHKEESMVVCCVACLLTRCA